jgi:hypothetical protein
MPTMDLDTNATFVRATKPDASLRLISDAQPDKQHSLTYDILTSPSFIGGAGYLAYDRGNVSWQRSRYAETQRDLTNLWQSEFKEAGFPMARANLRTDLEGYMKVEAAKNSMNTRANQSGLFASTSQFERSTLKKLNIDYGRVAEEAVGFKGNYRFLRGAGRFVIGALIADTVYNIYGMFKPNQSQDNGFRGYPWMRNDQTYKI